MKGNNPLPCQYTALYSQPSQPQLKYKAEDDLYYFPPIRVGNDAPLAPSITARCSPPRSRAAQQNMDDYEDELLAFLPIKERNDTPIFPSIPGRSLPRPQAAQMSQQLPLSSQEGPSSRRCRQPNMGLGSTNILNTVHAIAPVQAKSSLKRDSRIQDVANERLLKRQHVTVCDEDEMGSVRCEIASLKESVEKVAAEARDIKSMLEELIRET